MGGTTVGTASLGSPTISSGTEKGAMAETEEVARWIQEKP